jgi:predicted ribosomally synthesized peptide with nif11-like leader
MSTAKELLKKVGSDKKFAKRLESAKTPADKKKILEANGFGNVTESDMKAYMSKSEGGTLDENDLATSQKVVDWVGAGAAIVGAAAAAAA